MTLVETIKKFKYLLEFGWESLFWLESRSIIIAFFST